MSELRPAPKPKPRRKKVRKPIRRSRVRQKAGKPKRFRARRDEAYTGWVRGQICLLGGLVPDDGFLHQCWGAIEAAHVISRGAGGGDRDNLVPLCTRAHQSQHLNGIKTFAQRWHLGGIAGLKKIAQQYTERYDRERSVG